MVAYVIANELMRKFGGDTVTDLTTACDAYQARLAAF
jgi:hypothetical protein